MSLTEAQHAAIADELVAAARDRTPVPLLHPRFAGMTVEDSYAVQRLWSDRLQAQGRTVVGRKIGLTSKAMQQATGIDEPDHGIILDDMVLPDGAQIDWSRYTHPRVEVELAFRLGADLAGEDLTVDDVLAATQTVVPALEILDSRIEMEGRTIVDTIADNAAMGAMVLGSQETPVDGLDLPWVAAVLRRNGEVEETGVAAGVLGHPALGVAWLAARLAPLGQSLTAGQLILSGSFTRPLWVHPGDTIEADYREVGSVSCRFQ